MRGGVAEGPAAWPGGTSKGRIAKGFDDDFACLIREAGLIATEEHSSIIVTAFARLVKSSGASDSKLPSRKTASLAMGTSCGDPSGRELRV